MRRLGRLTAAFLHMLFAAVLRAIVSGLVFTTCAMVMLHYLGVPIPWPSDLLDKFDGVGRLVSILS